MTEDIKVPPQNLDAEQSVLGAVLLDNEALIKALEHITADDFYRDSHRRLFLAMRILSDKGKAIDMITLTEHLDRCGELENVGGQSYLAELATITPTAANVKHHARIVKDKATRRALRDSLMRRLSIVDSADIEDINRPLDIVPTEVAPEFVSIGDVLSAENEARELIEGILHEHSITLLSAPPSYYKTILSYLMSKSVSEGRPFIGRPVMRRPVIFVDKENPQSTQREYCRLVGIGGNSPIKLWPSWAETEPPPFPNAVYERIAREHENPLMVFDSLIRFYGKGVDENVATHIGPIMNFFRSLTRAGATVLLLHHAGKGKGSDYRGSSDILGGVDVAYSIKKANTPPMLTLKCIKSRFARERDIALDVRTTPDGLVFDSAPDQDTEEMKAIHDLLREKGLMNQSEIVESVRDSLGIRKKGRVWELLKKGEGEYWSSKKDGRQKLYEPVSNLSFCPPYKGGDNGTVDDFDSRDNGTVEPLEDSQTVDTSQLSPCPVDTGTVGTDAAIEVTEVSG